MKDEFVVIPKATISRLPLYFRVLSELDHVGVTIVSSEEMATKVGITSSQLRKDLSYFGGLGIRGTGYDVSYLLAKIKEILGMNQRRRLAIIGAGKLGTALAGYGGFLQHGLEVKALFDIDETKIGWKFGEIGVYHISELKRRKKEFSLDIATIAVPAAAAQQVAEMAVEVGFNAIWNFAPVRLEVPESVYVRNEDLVVGVLILSHHLTRINQ
ncbi:MAG: redox-sensing transcriptional repressor Rex [Firmicutes bacterium]|nr:redox-sensing transcriptional repressor Rex [Bacillota bacterium]